MNPNFIKQAQQLQAKLTKAQQELGEMTTEVTVGGGAIKIIIDGKQQIRSITIAPEIVVPEEIEMLQDMILAGVNEAIVKSQEMATSHLGKITGGLNLPNIF